MLFRSGKFNANLVMSDKIVEVKKRYDDICFIHDQACEVEIKLKKKMKRIIHVYYELHSFHQNHRLYVKSYSSKQFDGKEISNSHAEDHCNSAAYLKDFSRLYK